MPPTEITRFQAGSIQLVGLLRSYWLYDNDARPVSVTFPAESHLYDVIGGKYLGYKQEISAEMSYRAQLYAMSPYRVRALQIRGPDTCMAGAGASFTIAARPDGNAAPSKHVFRVEVLDPARQSLRHCWQGIEQTSPLTCIGGGAAPTVTKGMACWDATNLYIALVCAEPMLAPIQKKMANGSLAPFAESVEIFIDADQDRFTTVQLRLDILGNRDTHVRHDPDRGMDERWSGAAAQGQDQWTVEAVIPWKLVTDRSPEEATVWGLNLNRSRSIAADGGWTCWSDTKGGFHSPSRFGNLVFFPYPVFLRSYWVAVFRAHDEFIKRLTQPSLSGRGQLAAQSAANQVENDQFLASLGVAPITCGQDAAAYYARGLERQSKLAALQDEVLFRVIRDLAAAAPGRP